MLKIVSQALFWFKTPTLLQDSQKSLNSEGEDEDTDSEGEGSEDEEDKDEAGEGKTSASLARNRDESPNSRRVCSIGNHSGSLP